MPSKTDNSASDKKTLSPVYVQPKKPQLYNMATQTVGLFYPSERELQKKRAEEEEKWAMEKSLRDRKPLLTSVSPGKGRQFSVIAPQLIASWCDHRNLLSLATLMTCALCDCSSIKWDFYAFVILVL